MSTNSPAYNYQLAHIHEDKGPQTITASALLISITILAVLLRLTAQRIVKSSLTADDYCAVLALVSIYSHRASLSIALTPVLCCRSFLSRFVGTSSHVGLHHENARHA